MKHKEHILIGLLYLLSPFIGQLLVEKNILYRYTIYSYSLCYLLAISCYQHPSFIKNSFLSVAKQRLKN